MSTRRSFLAGTVGATIAATPLAASAIPLAANVNTALMTAIAAFWQADSTAEFLNVTDCSDDDMDDAMFAWYRALEAVMAIPAKTPAELQAKAAMAHKIFKDDLEQNQTPPEQARAEFFALMVLGELAGSATA